jgi:LemA protein
MTEVVIAVCIALGILLLVLLSTYNALMQQRQEVRAAWAQMDEFLKRRYDLIPALIAAVRSAGGETAGKLAAVSAAKNRAAVAFSPAELAQAETALSVAIQDVLAAAAADPLLNGNPAMIDIQRQLLGSEKQIDQARKAYNDRVDSLNSALTSFPQVLTARLIGLQPQPGFEFQA